VANIFENITRAQTLIAQSQRLIAEMQEIFERRHHSARARVLRQAGGVVECVFTGLMTDDALKVLGEHVRALTHMSPGGVLVRMDDAVIVGHLDPPKAHAAPAVAVICQAGQYDQISDYAARAASAGLMRAVFLPPQIAQARRWAQAHAAGLLQ